MASLGLSPSGPWSVCRAEGCGAAVASPDGRCLVHLEDEKLRLVLADSGPSRPLDGRGAVIDSRQLGRMLALAPTDKENRPFLKSALFDGATFLGPVRFSGVAFVDDVSFDGAAFHGPTSFDDAVFASHARFSRATFEGPAAFPRSRFNSHAWFAGASFGGNVDFEDAKFAGPAWFDSTAFAADVLFHRASFAGDTAFDKATFGCHTAFVETAFQRDVSLDTAAFNHPPRYDGARFKGVKGAPKGATTQAEWAGAPLASWSSRAAAALHDLAIPAGLVAGALLLPFALDRLNYHNLRPALLVLAVVASVALMARNLVIQGHSGQSRGKQRMGLCLVRQSDGLPVGPAASLLRYGLHLVDTVPFFAGWLSPIWNAKRQTFADQLTATVVVRQKGWAGAVPTREVGALPSRGFG